jgi:LacI family transcriptional regulator
MVTIVEIAAISKCSVSTVSKALNNYSDVSEKTRKRIAKIAHELGYVPNSSAQSLVTRKSNTIGIVFDIEIGLKHFVFSEILDQFRNSIEGKGYDLLLLSNNARYGLDYLDHSRYKQVDGVLIVASGRNQKAIQRMREANIRILFIDPPFLVNNSIRSDSYQGIQKACNYLYHLGHRKIAFIQGDNENYIGRERMKAYLEFVEDHELEPMWLPTIHNIRYSQEEGYQTMQAIFEAYGLPDAVCVASDTMAIGAIRCMQNNGYHVPNDISIVGFDNSVICDFVEPKLTSVKQDFQAIGRLACEKLVEMIEKDITEFEPIKLDTSIVVRSSCKSRIPK